MAPHSSTLAWRIPGTEEPGKLHTVHEIAKRLDCATNTDLWVYKKVAVTGFVYVC